MRGFFRTLRALLFLGIAVLCNATSGFAQATISLTHNDPRNAHLVDRDWAARLRNFSNSFFNDEIWIGSGHLSLERNRKADQLIWRRGFGENTFIVTYAPSPSPARLTLAADATTTGSQFYDFLNPVPNPNLFFTALASGASYAPVTLGVDIEAAAPASVINTSTVVGGGDIFFRTYLLLGNPVATEATVTVTYHLPDATSVTRAYVVAPQSRRTIDVNAEAPELASTAMAMSVTSTVPIVAERAMWWDAYPWSEGSSVVGSTVTGALWAIGEEVEGGPQQASTFVLVANSSAAQGTVLFTVVYDDGTRERKEYALLANARLTVHIGDRENFPNSGGRRFSVLVESLTGSVPITVEYSRYQSSTSLLDSGGAAVANRIR